MQICTSPQTDNHASTPPLSFLQASCPSCHPTASKHWRLYTQTQTCITRILLLTLTTYNANQKLTGIVTKRLSGSRCHWGLWVRSIEIWVSMIVDGEWTVFGVNLERPVVTNGDFATWLFQNYFRQDLFSLESSKTLYQLQLSSRCGRNCAYETLSLTLTLHPYPSANPIAKP